MFDFEISGSFSKTETFLQRMLGGGPVNQALNRAGKAGVQALAAATPVDSGATAHSWSYEITRKRGGFQISWTNSHIVGGVPLAILIQHGHGTGTGGYVQGRDFINPAIRPIFDQIANDVWKAVTSA